MSSQDFGIDNEGSGFGIDPNTDFSKLYEDTAARAHADPEDESYLRYMDDNFYDKNQDSSDNGQVYQEQSRSNQPTVKAEDPVVQEEEEIVIDEDPTWQETNSHETVSEDVPTYDSTPTTDETISYEAFEEYQTPGETQQEPEPAVIDSTPAPVQTPPTSRVYSTASVNARVQEQGTEEKSEVVSSTTPVTETVSSRSTTRFNIPSETDSIQEAQKIIHILDAYRKLDNKGIVAQLICNENDADPNDEARLVVKVLRADAMLGKMMKALREAASEGDRVERVFYILRLDDDLSEYLGEFITTVTGVEFENKKDKIGFSKQLEQSINELDKNIVQYVADAQSVLASFEK